MTESPAGWRWESYGGVEVGIPDSWGWGNGDQRLDRWKVGDRGRWARKPMVGRPGWATLVGYDTPRAGRPDPATLLENVASVVAFGRTPTRARIVENESDRTTVRLDRVEARIQAEATLRAQIVATLHTAVVDSNGCPSTHPVGQDPSQRPDPAIDVRSLTGVTAIAAGKDEW
ncbi:MAG TPA: hypothetical protein VIM10_16970 [Actinopolymorphaceae bacterium]